MKELNYAFVDLDSNESFLSLGQSFGGIVNHNTLYFDNPVVKGEIIKKEPEEGLWMRKWKLTVFQKITLQRLSAPPGTEKKFNLLYFINPNIFDLKNQCKKIAVNSQHNNVFFSNEVPMEFSVLTKQPFYVLDIAFTGSWLLQQINDAEPCFKEAIQHHLANSDKPVLMEPCTAEEYQTLHELEASMMAEEEDALFIRSRVYKMIGNFLNKLYPKSSLQTCNTIQYEQLVAAEKLIRENLFKVPKIATIAKAVNMSMSSLIRQFKMMYGKTVNEYVIEKKMELAKKMILENNISIKELSARMGYKKASPFIEMFTKQHGCSPGKLKISALA